MENSRYVHYFPNRKIHCQKTSDNILNIRELYECPNFKEKINLETYFPCRRLR